MPAILALGRWRKEDWEFQASLGDIKPYLKAKEEKGGRELEGRKAGQQAAGHGH